MKRKSNNEKDTAASILTILFVGTVAIAIMLLFHVSLGYYVSTMLAYVSSFILGLALVIGGSAKWGPAMIFTGVIAIAAAGTGILFYTDYFEARGGETIRGISVDDAIRYPQASRFYFTDGIVMKFFTAKYVDIVYTRSGTNIRQPTSYYYYAAPLVRNEGADIGVINAWVCARYAEDMTYWKDSYRAAIRVGSQDLPYFRKAIALAENKYNLKSSPDAPVLKWVKSPDAEIDRLFLTAAGSSIFWMVLFWSGIIGFHIYRKFSGDEANDL